MLGLWGRRQPGGRAGVARDQVHRSAPGHWLYQERRQPLGEGTEVRPGRCLRHRRAGPQPLEGVQEGEGAQAELAQARNRQDGHPVVPIVWVGPDRWAGFGRPLPFVDAGFDAVLFTCGDPYIPAGQRGDVYREIARVLTPGGRLGVLTRCRPDVGARCVASFWLRIFALAHDFAESVCEGWEGFSDAEESTRMFSDAGFQGGSEVSNAMSFLDSSLWVLRKARAYA